MAFLYFILAVLVSPLFAFKLYRRCEEYPDAFVGEAGKFRAKRVFIAFVTLSMLSGIVIVWLYYEQLLKLVNFVASIFIGSFVVVLYLTHQPEVKHFVIRIVKKVIRTLEPKPKHFECINGGKKEQ